MSDKEYQEHIQYTHNAYCRIVIRHASIDAARMLTEQQIPTPGTLEYRRTGSTRRYHPGYECKWATNTVVHILENREYTGCLVNFKTDKRRQDCYICGSYKKRTRDCTAHFIRTDLLTAGVVDNLRKVTSYAAKHEARFMKLLIEQNEDGGKRHGKLRRQNIDIYYSFVGKVDLPEE